MSPSGDSNKNLGRLSEPTRQFMTVMLSAFPEWAGALEIPGSGEASANDDCWFCVTPPGHPTHRLYVEMQGNSVEVRYDDGEPPGPAEKLFVDLDQSAAMVAEAVIGFVRDVMSSRIVVVRERLDKFSRLLRRDCESLARFRNLSEVEGRPSGTFVAVYQWTVASG